jgi:rhodanese-related sulfurtransferase
MNRARRRAVSAAALLALLTGSMLTAGGCAADGSSSATASASERAGYLTGTVQQAHERASSGSVLLVDVREAHEFDAGRSADALHVPLGSVSSRLDAIADEADGRPVWFVCRSGRRSAEAAATAAGSGRLASVVNVDGGMGAWVSAGLPIVPSDGRVA